MGLITTSSLASLLLRRRDLSRHLQTPAKTLRFLLLKDNYVKLCELQLSCLSHILGISCEVV